MIPAMRPAALMRTMCAVATMAVMTPMACGAAGDTVRTARKPIAYVSSSPRFLKAALTEDGGTAVILAFDESRGTGKGYDLMYAINCGTTTGTLRYVTSTASVKSDEESETWTFQPVRLPVIYKPGLKGGKNPFVLTMSYRREKPQKDEEGRPVATSTLPSAMFETFNFETAVTLVDSNCWTYTTKGECLPVQDSRGLVAFDFVRGDVAFDLSSNRMETQQHMVGLSADLRMESCTFECTRNEKPVNVVLAFKNTNGVCVLNESVPIDKLRAKVVEPTGRTLENDRNMSRGARPSKQAETKGSLTGYVVQLPSGAYFIEATVDLGPLKGVVTWSKQTVL